MEKMTKLVPWKVFLGDYYLDTVYFQESMDSTEVAKSLIDHDGFDDGIHVIKANFIWQPRKK